MSHVLIDLYNNILEYGRTKIDIIVDSDGITWYPASVIAKILGYKNKRQAIILHVPDYNKKPYSELAQYQLHPKPNMQSHTIFINESGLYLLTDACNLPIGRKFRHWIFNEVIPSIKKFGNYQMKPESKTELDAVIDQFNQKIDRLKQKHEKELKERDEKLKISNDRIKFKNAEIKRLKFSLKKNVQYKGKRIYAMQPYVSDKRYIKIGKTKQLTRRKTKAETTVPDKMKVLYTIEVDSPTKVEKCIQLRLEPYIFRAKKDYYECSLKKVIESMNACKEFVETGFHCNKCNEHHEKLSELMDHSINHHDLNLSDNMIITLPDIQTGGTDNIDSFFDDIVLSDDPSDNLINIPTDGTANLINVQTDGTNNFVDAELDCDDFLNVTLSNNLDATCSDRIALPLFFGQPKKSSQDNEVIFHDLPNHEVPSHNLLNNDYHDLPNHEGQMGETDHSYDITTDDINYQKYLKYKLKYYSLLNIVSQNKLYIESQSNPD